MQIPNLDAADPCLPLDGYHTDVPRLERGRRRSTVLVRVRSGMGLRRRFARRLSRVDLVQTDDRAMRSGSPMAESAADVVAARKLGMTASLMGAEGGHAIENSLAALRTLRRLGVRYMTLTHMGTPSIGRTPRPMNARHGGLTDFGEDVVREMNRIGMVVDISHVSADTMRHALSVSDQPGHGVALERVCDRSAPEERSRRCPRVGARQQRCCHGQLLSTVCEQRSRGAIHGPI